jgi:predicted RNA-binding protein with PUA-like domain
MRTVRTERMMLRMTEIEELKMEIKNESEWNLRKLTRLAKLLGMEDEWKKTDGDNFETIAHKMIEI